MPDRPTKRTDELTRDPEQKTVRQRSLPHDVPVAESIHSFYQHTPLSLQTLPGQQKWTAPSGPAQGRYQVGGEIGHGGMGVVRVVTDLNLGRRVAMKSLLARHVADPNLLQAMINEARLTGQLEHPNIVPIYELGVTASGTPYYTMKLLDKSSLREVLRSRIKGEPSVLEEYTQHRLLNIFSQVCLGCHYAHSRGVVHRDIKPENILIGEFGEVLIVDWGIARVFHSKEGRPDAGSSDEGMIVGTPTYMSPEQAEGSPDVDQRSDVYSLGMILYEMITGRLPVEHMESARHDTVPGGERAQLTFEFDDRKIPGELIRICQKCLLHDPGRRYQSARALFKDIDDFLEGSKQRERMRKLAAAEVERGDAGWSTYFDLVRQKDELERKIDADERAMLPWDSIAKRQRWWEEKLRLTNLALMATRAFSDAVKFYHRALGYEPANESARAGLGTLYWARFVQAEEARNFADQVYFGNLAQEIGGGVGEEPGIHGSINIRTVPDGATVYLIPYDEISSDFSHDARHQIGVSPIGNILRESSGYLVVVHKEGFRDAHQPVFVQPGETSRLLITLSPWFADIPLIGREFELRGMKTALRDCVDLSEMQCLAVVGPPGAGKARLLHAFNQFVNDLDELFNFMYVECRPLSQMLPYSSLVELIRHRAGLGSAEPYGLVRQKIIEMVTLAYTNFGTISIDESEQQEIEETVNLLLALPAFDVTDPRRAGVLHRAPEDYRARILKAMVNYFRRLASGEPVLIVATDGQWMDPCSRAFFRDLLQQLSQLPVLVVTTIGVGEATVERGEKSPLTVDFPFTAQLRLGPLSSGAIKALIRETLKAPVTPEAMEIIGRGIADSPFYIQDYLHFLVHQGHLVKRDRRWTIVKPEEITSFEERIPVVLLLDELGDEIGEFLKQAAIVGEVFWTDVVPAQVPRGAMEELVRREVIFKRSRSRYAGSDEYKFGSRTERRVLYSLVPPEQQKTIHLSTALWIEEHGRIDLEESMRLAWHLEKGGQQQRAAEIYWRIARVVEGVGGTEEAAVHIEQSLRLDPDSPERDAILQKRQELKQLLQPPGADG